MTKRKSKGSDEGAKAKAKKGAVTDSEVGLKEVRELPHVKKFEDWL